MLALITVTVDAETLKFTQEWVSLIAGRPANRQLLLRQNTATRAEAATISFLSATIDPSFPPTFSSCAHLDNLHVPFEELSDLVSKLPNGRGVGRATASIGSYCAALSTRNPASITTAESLLNQAISLSPQNPIGYKLLLTFTQWRRTSEMDPNRSKVLSEREARLAAQLLDLQRKAQPLTSSPLDPSALMTLGGKAYRAGDFRTALEYYEQIDRNFTVRGIALTAAVITSYRKIGLFEKAKALCTDAKAYRPPTASESALAERILRLDKACLSQ